MKKITVVFFLIILTLTTLASYTTGTDAKVTREELLEDAVIDLLQNQMYAAVEDYYGTTVEKALACQRVIEIKKLDHPGSWLFEAELEGVTYTGAHHPLDIFTVKVVKDWETEGKWVMQNYKVKKFRPGQEFKCRQPV